MSGLQLLSSYLTEVVKEILRVVEDTVTEHREDASRCRRESQTLRSQNQSLRSHNQTLTNQNQTLRSQLRDLLLLEARAEWPKAGQTHSFSLEQLSLSENSTSAVTPPTRCSVPAPQAKTPPTFPSVNAPQEPVVLPEQKQEEEQKELVLSPELVERKPLASADVRKYQPERAAEGPRAAAEGPQTTEGPRTAALSPAPVRVKEEPEEWSLTESEAEEPRGDQALSLTGLEREEDGEDGEEDSAEWREDDGGDWGGTNGAWKDLDLEETGLSLKPEDDPPSEAQTDRPPPTVTQMLPQSPPHSAPRCPQSHSAPRCPRCSEVFPSPAALLQHLHQAQKTHRCSFCCKSFSQSADLRRHHRTHTGERPHRCTFCSRAFSQRGNLRRHLRIHTGERPYGCLYCHRRFSDGDTLKKHLRTHSQGPQQDHSQGPRLQPGLNQV